MHKIFLKTLFIFFFLIQNVISETITEIQINGNQRISDQTILVLGQISKGDKFDDNKINDSLKNLYNTNFFNDIDITLSNGLLTINLSENPIIEDIEILGIKNKSVLEKLYESISLKNRMSFTEQQLVKDKNLIKNILKTNGFYFAELKSSIIKNDELNSIRLKIEIDRGEKARIKEIVFIGDKKIKDKKLLKVIASEEHKFWKFVSNKVYLNQF